MRALMNGIERRTQESIDDAADAGLTGAVEKLTEAQGYLEQAHAAFNALPPMLAAHFGDTDVTPYSGGDDKPPQ
jgi:hypothetical protein